MAYRTPEAECYLINGCGLDKAHNHTYRFSSKQQQENFFISKALSSGHYSALYEIRLYDGFIKVKGNANVTYAADYVMFRNVPSGNKNTSGRWFYAFVDSIEYVSDSVFQINYTIDWIQTYLIDVISSPNYAFCVREHSATDVLYQNTQPDSVPLGGFYMQKPVSGWSNIGVETTLSSDGTFVGYAPVIVAPRSDYSLRGLTDGIPNSVEYYWGFNWKWFSDLLNEFNDDAKKDIIDIYMYPVYLLNTDSTGEKRYIQNVPMAGKNYNPWGFTPKNKKLFTYPYCFLTVAGANQGGREYRFERFDSTGNEVTFRIYGTMGTVPEFICLPVSYGGVTNADQQHLDENFFEAVTIKGSPKVPWITDQYKAWLAQKESQIAIQQIRMSRDMETAMLSGSFNTVASLGSVLYNPLGTIGTAKKSLENAYNTSMDVMSQQAQLQDAKNMPIVASNYATSDIYYKCGEYGFRAMYTYIPDEYAKIIDDFWTAFGYPVGRVKKPNFYARPSYIYLKYNGYNPVNIPSLTDSARTQWQNVLQKGVTFWESSVGIGNYAANNSV